MDHHPVAGLESERLRSEYRSAVISGLLALVISRLGVIVAGGVRASQRVVDANLAGLERPRSATGFISELLTSWDGLWYLEIARSGYPRSVPPEVTYFDVEARAAFFPLFPQLVSILDRLLPGGDTIAVLVLNLGLSVAAVLLVGALARRYTGDPVTVRRSMVLFAVFPGSFVLSFAYAEALLIVLAAGCLIALHDQRWLLAGILAAFATATRPNGVALVAAVGVAAWLHYRRDHPETRSQRWRVLAAVAMAPMGFIAFQIFLAVHTGETGVWFRVQREAWEEGTSFGVTAVSNTIGFVTDPFGSPTNAITAATVAAAIVAVWAARRCPLPAPAMAYNAVVLALMVIPATVTARPRFLFTAFPLVIAVAAWWPRRPERDGWDVMMVACGIGLVGLSGLYGALGAIP